MKRRRSPDPGRSVLAVLALCAAGFVAGCDKPATPSKTGSSKPVAKKYEPTRTEFGDSKVNFVSFVDAFGSFAVVHSFDRDTNQDGKIEARLGDHGEPEADWPSANLITLPDGGTTRFDELITSSADGRWVVLRTNDKLVAFSAGRQWEIAGADLRPDPSPCMPARQASIDPTGRWLVFLRSSPNRAVVKDLNSGKEREVVAQSEIWRADAMPRGWMLLREVVDSNDDGKAEFPRREGTCVCRWCSRFASSVGKSRLAGDASKDVLIDGRGERYAAGETPLPVGFDLVWSITKQELTHLDGKSARLGQTSDGEGTACGLQMAPLGSHYLVLDCGGKSVVWESNTGRRVPVERNVRALDTYAPPNSAGRVPVAYQDDGGARRVGLLDLGSGGIEPGPKAIRWGAPHPSGWRLVADASETHAFDAATGTFTKLDLHGAELTGLTALASGRYYVIDPTKPKPLEVSGEPRWVAANGCYIEPHEHNQLHSGPFVWVCP